MAFTQDQIKKTVRYWVRWMYVRLNATADFDTAHLAQVITAIDNFFAAQVSTLNDAQTVEQALNSALPQPFRGAASLDQKASGLASWAMERAGILPPDI
jgi:hypothetical protein